MSHPAKSQPPSPQPDCSCWCKLAAQSPGAGQDQQGGAMPGRQAGRLACQQSKCLCGHQPCQLAGPLGQGQEGTPQTISLPACLFLPFRCPQGHMLTAARMDPSALPAPPWLPRCWPPVGRNPGPARLPVSSSFLPRALCGSATLPCRASTSIFWGWMGTFTMGESPGDLRLGPSLP